MTWSHISVVRPMNATIHYILGLALVFSAAADAQVSIPDTSLQTALAKALGKASSEGISAAEMQGLTELFVENDRISDLTGLEHATNLTQLTLRDINVADITPLAALTNLAELTLHPVYRYAAGSPPLDLAPLAALADLTALSYRPTNRYADDLSPLAGLNNLTRLELHGVNHYTSHPAPLDLLPLARLTKLTELNLPYNHIDDIAPLAGLTGLTALDLRHNDIVDVNPLAGLLALHRVFLSDNNIANLAPLRQNTGLGRGDVVEVETNPLDLASIGTHIPALQALGVRVSFDRTIVITEPQIYNDNLFVLPVAENLARGNLPLENYTARFYSQFKDEFDFLIFVPNLAASQHDPGVRARGYYSGVQNDVQGIGEEIYAREQWGTAKKLQGVINLGSNSLYTIPDRGRSILSEGPVLHELLHRWANFIVPSSSGGHWGFSSANGNIGGFDLANLVDHGANRFTAGDFSGAGIADDIQPCSPIELYLMGFIPPDQVPDLWVAPDGAWLVDGDGNNVRAANGDWIFTASQITTYSIEDIIAAHGTRVPDHTQAQKNFRAAVILLLSADFPATQTILETLSRDVSWFSYAGADASSRYNFYEATGGRGTLAMDGLERRRHGAPRGHAATVTKLSGTDQRGWVGAALAEPLVIEVLDQYGAPHAGATVTFAITSGEGTLAATTASTDSRGLAAATLTLGRVPGLVTVAVWVDDLESVTFSALAQATPDFNGDGMIDFVDFFLFADAFGTDAARFDLDGSGVVDYIDFFLFAEAFGQPARAKLLTLAAELIGLPTGPQLRQNVPNPFNSATVIPYFLLEPGPARLEVYALTGQLVAVLHQGPQPAGFHRLPWDGKDSEGRSLASGVYLYRLVLNSGAQTRKLTILR